MQCLCPVLHKEHNLSEERDDERIKAAIRRRYHSRMNPTLSLTVSICGGPAGKRIMEHYRKHHIDLILLNRKRSPFWKMSASSFEALVDRISKKIKCPVFNIRLEAGIPLIRPIVLPVGEQLPMRKLLFATYLAKLSGSAIHLIATEGKNEKAGGGRAESLHRSYRLLKENTDLPVECWSLPEENLAAAALAYAKRMDAGLILIDPGKESQLPGFWSGLHPRSLFNVSRIPVLTVPLAPPE
jgi:hypothetical protein